jgi:hypothetical protein
MGTYRAWVEKNIKCLCERFEPGGLFSPNKFTEKCGGNFNTAKKHLEMLAGREICGEKWLVRIAPGRYTIVVPDDPFEPNEVGEEWEKSREGWQPFAYFAFMYFVLNFVSGFIEGLLSSDRGHQQALRYESHVLWQEV